MTALAAWLKKRGESPYAFAIRLGMYAQSVYALCGVRSSKAPAFFKTGTLERVSAETGIPVHRLYADWASVDPRPARPRGRPKSKSGGAAADGGRP